MSEHANTSRDTPASGIARTPPSGIGGQPLGRLLPSVVGTSIRAVVLLTVVLGLAYPLVVTGLGQALWPKQANGSRVTVDGRLVGSSLIGESFAGRPGDFQSRPSSTEYDPGRTGASNLGPNAASLAAQLRARMDAYLRRERPYLPTLRASEVPPDAVTASGSGVDPDISLANARIQSHRVAAVRGVPLARVLALVRSSAHSQAGGVLEPESVNVLDLNLALERLGP